MIAGYRNYLAGILILAGLYFAAGKLGLAMAFEHANVSPVWPPTGLALAALLIVGPRFWPGITLGAFLVNVTTTIPNPLPAACGIALGNTLEALIGAWLLTRVAPLRPELDRLKDVLGLLFYGAILSTMASASVGVVTLCLGDSALWADSWRLWWRWWVGDAMGDLVVAPVVLLLSTGPRIADLSQRKAEALALLGGLLGAGWIIFGRRFDESYLDNSYWLFPFLIWAALRFGPPGIVSALLLASALAIVGTLNGYGPFIRASAGNGDSLVLLQMFLGIATITGLILASITAEREGASQALRQLNEELEQRVADRTNELDKTNRQLAHKNEENEAFVYSVSHDLRSPLVNLQGFSQELSLVGQDLRNLLAEKLVPEGVQQRGLALLNGDMAQSIQFIQSGVLRLSTIIDSLLRLSRIGRVEYRLQSVDVNAVVARIVASLQATIAERSATVTVANLPSVWGDPTTVDQILANLIGNALNYLDPKRPGVVHIGCEPAKPGADSRATIFVKDNGLGIAEHHRVKLFQMFQRLHPEVAKGEGVGLALVWRMVERHGGKIWVESTVGVGSTFYVTLPAQSPDADRQDIPVPVTMTALKPQEVGS